METAPRRSSRQKTANVPAVAESSTSGQQQHQANQGPEDDSSEDEFQTPLAGKRKRKASVEKTKDVKTQGKGAKKPKLRKGQGVLRQILEMPFDILFEIFGHLLPCDLLSLSRTSKEFSRLILGPQFKSIWIHSRSHVEELPDCPEDMSEPQYAELAFGKGCLVCSKGGVTITIWQARTRLCYSCIDDIFVTISYISRLGLPASVVPLVPHTYLRHKQRYSPKYGHKWADEYKELQSLKEQEEWELAKNEQVKEANRHAMLCQSWQRSFAQVGSYQKMDDKRERKARMAQMAKSMGWDEDLVDELDNNAEIDRLCSRKLTDKAFENARPLIEKLMTEALERRTLQERMTMHKTRIELLHTTYKNAVQLWHSLLKFAPRVSDIFVVPRIKSVVIDTPPEITVTSEHFGITKDTLPLLMEEANDIIREKLLNMVKAGRDDKDYDPATVLDLASTVFSMQHYEYHRTFMNTRQALHHKLPTQYYYSSDKGTIESLTYEVFQAHPWGHTTNVSFNVPGHTAACSVLTLCGLEPLTVTAEEVEAIDPIIECLACNQATTGRLVMRWLHAASHAVFNHSGSISDFSLVDEKDTLRAKEKFRDQDEITAYQTSVWAKCTRCDHISTISATRRHLWEEHQITYPEPEDMETAERTSKSSSCRLWPARPC